MGQDALELVMLATAIISLVTALMALARELPGNRRTIAYDGLRPPRGCGGRAEEGVVLGVRRPTTTASRAARGCRARRLFPDGS